MRRLQILPCPEAWERMQPDGDGRFCARCQLHVTDTTTLDEEALASFGTQQRSCGRFELEGGHPRTKLGVAAGVLVVVLAGCATPASVQPTAPDIAWSELVDEAIEGRGTIAGVVRDAAGAPVENALVILQSTALTESQERMTSARGVYAFVDLPAGNYTIQVLAGKANVSKITMLPEGARFRANFRVAPDVEIIVGGLVWQDVRAMDTTTASSTYSSKMIEIP